MSTDTISSALNAAARWGQRSWATVWSQSVYGPLRSERTQLTDRARARRLVAFFGDQDARTLTEARVRQFAAAFLEEGKSASLAVGCLSILRRVLNLAVQDGLLARNPVPKIATIMRDTRDRAASEVSQADAWTRDEADRLLALDREPQLYPVLLFAFHTGARRGEIVALRWEDIDFGRRRVQIRRTARLGSRGTKVPKARRARSTPLSGPCLAMLERQREAQRRATLAGHPTPEWVFASPMGKLWNEHNLERSWLRLRRRALAEGVRPLKLHCTRNSFVTWALEAGTPLARVAEWVGASLTVLEHHYAHAMPEADDALRFLEGSEPGRDRASAGPNRATNRVSW